MERLRSKFESWSYFSFIGRCDPEFSFSLSVWWEINSGQQNVLWTWTLNTPQHHFTPSMLHQVIKSKRSNPMKHQTRRINCTVNPWLALQILPCFKLSLHYSAARCLTAYPPITFPLWHQLGHGTLSGHLPPPPLFLPKRETGCGRTAARVTSTFPPSRATWHWYPLAEELIAVSNHHVSPPWTWAGRRRGKPHNKHQHPPPKFLGKNSVKKNLRMKETSVPEQQKSSQGLTSSPNEAILSIQLLLTLPAVKPLGKMYE